MIVFNNEQHGLKIANECGTTYSHDNPVIGRVLDGVLVGGVLFREYTGVGGSIAIHVASWRPRWISRDMLWVTFDYPFNQLQVKKLFGQVPRSNKKALAFDLNLGFKVEHIIRDVYPSDDMVLLSMYKSDCRFLDIVPRNPLR